MYQTHLKELRDFEASNPGSTKVFHERKKIDIDNTPASLLRIRGRQNVHLLYDWMLNHRKKGSSEDVPLLHCSTPFIHATLQVSLSISLITFS